MKAMILTAFIFVSLEILVVDAVTFRILRVENCTSSNKSIHVEKCDGVENRFSIILDVHRPLNKLNVQLSLFKSEYSQFKPLFKSKPVEWCSLVSGKSSANPIVKTFIKANLEKLPPVIRKCPMEGRLDMKNIVLSSRVMAVLPLGIYRIQARSFDKVDKEIMVFSTLFKIDDN